MIVVAISVAIKVFAKLFASADTRTPPVLFQKHYRNHTDNADQYLHMTLSIVCSCFISGICGLKGVTSMTEGHRNG